jgi:hypothetical protein
MREKILQTPPKSTVHNASPQRANPQILQIHRGRHENTYISYDIKNPPNPPPLPLQNASLSTRMRRLEDLVDLRIFGSHRSRFAYVFEGESAKLRVSQRASVGEGRALFLPEDGAPAPLHAIACSSQGSLPHWPPTRTRRGTEGPPGEKKSGLAPRHRTASHVLHVFELSRRSGRSPALPYPPRHSHRSRNPAMFTTQVLTKVNKVKLTKKLTTKTN